MIGQTSAYEARMQLILRWRRVGNMFCLFLAAYGVVILVRDPKLAQPSHALLVGSLLAFIAAGQGAMTIFTLLLRK